MRASLGISHSFPRKIEAGAVRYAWLDPAIDLTGTAFDFRYYVP